MKSTSGEHYVGLDHIRAVAAMLVFSWHFMHGFTGRPVPFEGTPFFGPLVLFDEGHCGVALFMTLSGYLFAKLLDGRQIMFGAFLWNRALRLLPLLLVVFVLVAIDKAVRAGDVQAAYTFFLALPGGFVFPTWPNGAWSIAVEMHFYLLLPALLFFKERRAGFLWVLLALSVMLRVYLHSVRGEVQSLAYWTIVGRIDQFVLGIIAFHHRAWFIRRPVLAGAIAFVFMLLYWWFDRKGGFFLQPSYPSPARIWIVLPTLEGLAFAALIAWYDGSFVHRPGLLSTLLTKCGEYSYSIYLLHVFFVFSAAEWIHVNLMDLSSLYVAFPVSMLAFAAMVPIGYLSMRFIEQPFLKMRRPYFVKKQEARSTDT
jgi:peptidoglycan/LPS O-acetylase OafA/YrhL